MKDSSSITWRADNDAKAFDSEEWEFRSKQFVSSAGHLIQSFDDEIESLTFQSMMFLPTAESLLSFSIELMSKAYFLMKGNGPMEKIYTHNILELFTGDEITAGE